MKMRLAPLTSRPRLLPLLLPALLLQLPAAGALENGVARTPPLGWMTWQRYRCNTNCSADPHNCISEALIWAPEFGDRNGFPPPEKNVRARSFY